MTLPINDPRDYAANIFARFGIDTSDRGTWPELAKLENKAMRARLQSNPGARAVLDANQQRIRITTQYSAHDAAITAMVAESPVTAREVAQALSLHLETARDHLRRLTLSGRITRGKQGGAFIYTAMEEAA